MKSNLAEGWLDEMRMLNIEVLKDFQRERAVFLRSWQCLQYLFKSMDEQRYNKLIFLIDCILIILIFLAKDPSIYSLSNRYLLLLEEPQ